MSDNSPDPHLVRRAEAGDPEAQTDLGVFYSERIPEPGAAETAEMWLGRAAAQNHPNAKHNLGVLFHQLSDQHEQNWDRALNWFWQAAQDGFLPSIYIVANVLWNAGKRDQALVLFDKAARQGHPESQGALARAHLMRETEEGYRQARYWAELAAPHNVASVQTVLGQIYHEGLATARDPAQAMAWFKLAARNDHPGAQLLLGAAYEAGVGVEHDRVEAAFWLMRSAAQGNEGAKAYLNRFIGKLDGTEQELLRRRTEPGITSA